MWRPLICCVKGNFPVSHGIMDLYLHGSRNWFIPVEKKIINTLYHQMFFLFNSSISCLESYSREIHVYVYREAAFRCSRNGISNSERWRPSQSWPVKEAAGGIDETWLINIVTVPIFLILYIYLCVYLSFTTNVYLCGQEKNAKMYYLERMKSLRPCFVHYYLFVFKTQKKMSSCVYMSLITAIAMCQ